MARQDASCERRPSAAVHTASVAVSPEPAMATRNLVAKSAVSCISSQLVPSGQIVVPVPLQVEKVPPGLIDRMMPTSVVAAALMQT